MNKVYLSGIVAEPPVCYSQEGSPEHVCFPLRVTHRTRQGVLKGELYPVHGWNGAAAWARQHLRQGQRVLVQGYLTQRTLTAPGEAAVTLCEVTAEEFFPGEGSGGGDPGEKPGGQGPRGGGAAMMWRPGSGCKERKDQP